MPIDWERVRSLPEYSPPDYPEDAVRLDLNESPYPPPPEVVEAVAREAARANRYPEARLYRELEEELAAYAGVDPGEVVVTAGGDEALEALFALPTRGERAVVILDPSFSMFRVYAGVFGWTVHRSSLRPCGGEWCANPDELLNLSRTASMAVLDQPNNPTGTGLVDRSTLSELARSLLLVIDEAYYEFAGVTSIDLVAEGAVVVRTMSKAFGLAGLRVGYLVAQRETARLLRRLLPPFRVARTSLAAALAALRSGYRDRVVREVVGERERLRTLLASMGLRVFRSLTNFLLVETPVENIVEKLASMRVYVRRVPMGSNWARVTVGTRRDSDALVAALQSLLGGAGHGERAAGARSG